MKDSTQRTKDAYDRAKDPIERVKWVDAGELSANGWNPNMVLDAELRLLERSIMKQGWIQPVLVSSDMVIIDGFHRWRLSIDSKAVHERYGGKLPVVVIDADQAESRMLTVRINRAKGAHAAIRMSELVKELIDDLGCEREEVARGIGADISEVDLLYQGSIFNAKGLKNYRYSKAWVPRETTIEYPS